jgi:hypothetical protein
MRDRRGAHRVLVKGSEVERAFAKLRRVFEGKNKMKP